MAKKKVKKMIHTINSQDAFEQFLRIECRPGQVLVVQFSAVWCGPCKKISPHIETIVSKYETIQFIKIDLDEEDISRATIHTLDLCPSCKRET